MPTIVNVQERFEMKETTPVVIALILVILFQLGLNAWLVNKSYDKLTLLSGLTQMQSNLILGEHGGK